MARAAPRAAVRAAAARVGVLMEAATAVAEMVAVARVEAMAEGGRGEAAMVAAEKAAVATAVATVVVWAAVTVVAQCRGRRCTAVRYWRSPQPSTCHLQQQGQARRSRRCLQWTGHPSSWRSCTGRCS